MAGATKDAGSQLGSVAELNSTISRLQHQLALMSHERDMWKGLAQESDAGNSSATDHGQSALPELPVVTTRNRSHTSAEAVPPGAPAAPASAKKMLRPRSSASLNSLRCGENKIPDSPESSQKFKKAAFDIVQCTDEKCDLVRPSQGIVEQHHVSALTAKLMWRKQDKPTSALLIKKPGDTASTELLISIAKWLVDVRSFTTVLLDPAAHEELSDRLTSPVMRAWTETERENLHKHIDFVVTIGGDGTVLWTCLLFNGPVPPVVPFAMGSLGFLTPFRGEHHQEVLGNFMDRGATISIRSRLCATITHMDGSAPVEHHVLNEVVVDRGPASTLGNLMAYCNDEELTRVQADGLIIGTPTGSTAYSLSAGGSIVHPALNLMVFTPICPHTLSFRPMVFPDSSVLRVEVPEDARSTAWVAFDGAYRTEMQRGDSIEIRVGKYPLPVVSLVGEQSDWLSSLKSQLFWNMRISQKRKET